MKNYCRISCEKEILCAQICVRYLGVQFHLDFAYNILQRNPLWASGPCSHHIIRYQTCLNLIILFLECVVLSRMTFATISGV